MSMTSEKNWVPSADMHNLQNTVRVSGNLTSGIWLLVLVLLSFLFMMYLTEIINLLVTLQVEDNGWCKAGGVVCVCVGGVFRCLLLGSWVFLRACARLDSPTQSPPQSSAHIITITGSFWAHEVRAATLLAHQRMRGRHRWNRTPWLCRFTGR